MSDDEKLLLEFNGSRIGGIVPVRRNYNKLQVIGVYNE
jgi:hypothetical protein